jgi:ribosomal protein L11 methyltransferase
VEVSCHPEICKAVLWRLRGPGHRASAVKHADDQVTVWAFLSAENVTPQEIARLWLGLQLDAAERRLPNPRITWQRTDAWDWPAPIKELIVPQEVGRRLTIVPHGTKPEDPDRIAIRLDGRFGFGVGGVHSTTRLCLEALERRLDGGVPGGAPVCLADIGCGAGDLGIAAILLGAERVYAVDTKAASVLGTRQNRELNGIHPNRLIVEQGSVSDVSAMVTTPLDGFVCNILTRIIIHLIPRFKVISGSGTWGILSGIREAELGLIERALEEHGWKTAKVTRKGGWCCVEVSRGE